jgi:hypothetical protein
MRSVDEKLLTRALSSPSDLSFGDLCKLAESMGFEHVRTTGSHRIFHHPRSAEIRDRFQRPFNCQPGKHGKAKTYQVRELLEQARALAII